MLLRLPLGARIALARAPTSHAKLRGTELLLTQAGRAQLTGLYDGAFSRGAGAVCTSLDTSMEHLDGAPTWSPHRTDPRPASL